MMTQDGGAIAMQARRTLVLENQRDNTRGAKIGQVLLVIYCPGPVGQYNLHIVFDTFSNRSAHCASNRGRP